MKRCHRLADGIFFFNLVRTLSFLFNIGLWVALLVACKQEKKPAAPPDQHQTEQDLYTLPGLDHGLIQSPVNILTSKLEEGTRHKIEVHRNHPERATAIVNTGHSVELEFEPGTSIEFDGVEYDFIQAHFHTPSEHQLDGMTFPMEIHFVNMKKSDNDQPPQYLVIAIFFKMGEENAFIAKFIDRIPRHEHDTVAIEDEPLILDELLGDMQPDQNYYTYQGSLTTPPYTETVRWLIQRTILNASPAQIGTINEIEGNNARHVQARYGRVIEGD
jgi:carbonic anhydrase